MKRNPNAGWVAIVAVLCVAAGAVASWRVAEPHQTETTIGRVSFSLAPSVLGEAVIFIPLADWGLQADAFDAPFELRAELRSLRRDALLEAAEGGTEVLAQTEEQLRDGARGAVVRGVGFAALGAGLLLVLATLLWRRLQPRWLLAAVGSALVVVASAATLVAANWTFDARAFQSPTYFARGSELERILELAQDETVESQYGSVFASVLRSLSAILADVTPGDAASREVYLASDLHANALVVRPLARAVGDAPLLFAGDVGQRGGALESRALAPRVAALAKRVVAVSGNHDSSTLMRDLQREGVSVLGEGSVSRPGSGQSTIELAGLRIAGYPDPLQWRGRGDPDDRPVTFDDLEAPEAAFDTAVADLATWFDRLPQRPDLVMVHQSGLAAELAASLQRRRHPLTIVTGHDHQQRVERFGRVTLVNAGSVGAGGIFDAGQETVGLARLRFERRQPVLDAVDLIQVEPFTGRAQATRVITASMCQGEVRCSVEPAETEVVVPAE